MYFSGLCFPKKKPELQDKKHAAIHLFSLISDCKVLMKNMLAGQFWGINIVIHVKCCKDNVQYMSMTSEIFLLHIYIEKVS